MPDKNINSNCISNYICRADWGQGNIPEIIFRQAGMSDRLSLKSSPVRGIMFQGFDGSLFGTMQD